MEDNAILALLWNRSHQAIEALASVFGTRLFQIARNILSDPLDAEETVNDTYLAVWNAIPPAKPDPLTGYVLRTCRNIALKRLRFQSAQKRSSAYTQSLDELADIFPGTTLEESMDARALGQAVDAFLSTLNKDNRRLFLRRYWFGDNLGDLSRQEGLSQNALSVRLLRLRQQLKDYLNKEGFFP